jgi:peptidoglycan/xylan/chitin deacetylase (PgdA/CDA1 family)
VHRLLPFALAAVLAGAASAATAGAPPAPVPILEYHVVGDPPPGAPYPELYVSVADFRAEMAWLARHGYHPVTLDAVWRNWHAGAPLPPRPVALTFDDGYPQDVDVVRPILQARRWPAMLNLHIGNLIPARVRRLVAAGWEIDSHTFTHPDLTTIGPDALRHEIADSRRWIQGVYHQPVLFFCYPSGRYDATVIAAVQRAGYAGAESERPVLASPGDRFELGRFEILRSDGVAGMAAKLGASP